MVSSRGFDLGGRRADALVSETQFERFARRKPRDAFVVGHPREGECLRVDAHFVQVGREQSADDLRAPSEAPAPDPV